MHYKLKDGEIMQYNVEPKYNPIEIKSPPYLKQFEFESSIKSALESENLKQIKDIKSRFCIFDLSESFWHDLGTLLWFISLLHRLKKQGNELQIRLPDIKGDDKKGEKIWDFLIRWRFFKTLSLCVDDPVNLIETRQLSNLNKKIQYRHRGGKDEFGEDIILFNARILEMSTFLHGVKIQNKDDLFGPYLNKLSDKIILRALSNRCGWELEQTKFFIDNVCGEGLRNSVMHAKGSYSTIAMKMDQKHLILTICDNGIGIPETLREAFKQSNHKDDLVKESDVNLIKYFTEPEMIIDSEWIKVSLKKGTTSKAKQRAGLGLYYLKSLVLNQGGRLRIRSGRACVDFLSNEESDDHDEMIESPGTMFRILVPVK